jgi:hypothetical protein
VSPRSIVIILSMSWTNRPAVTLLALPAAPAAPALFVIIPPPERARRRDYVL